MSDTGAAYPKRKPSAKRKRTPSGYRRVYRPTLRGGSGLKAGAIASYIHTFQRSALSYNVVDPGPIVLKTFPVYVFAMDLLPNYAEFQNLFESYRILRLELTIRPMQNNINWGDTLANPGAIGQSQYFVIDYRDANPLPAFNSVFEFTPVYECQFPGTHKKTISFTPKVQRMVYQSAIATSYELVPSSRIWLNTLDPSVPHYGIKAAISTIGLPAGQIIAEIMWTATIQCKNNK